MKDNFLQIALNSLNKNKPNLSDGSVKTYISTLRTIIKESEFDINSTRDIYENYKKILDELSNRTASNRKSKLACLVSIIDDKDEKDNEPLQEALKGFRKQMLLDTREVDARYNKQDLTENQKKNLIPQEQVIEIYQKLRAQATPLFKFDILNKQQFNLMQSFVLLSLYVLIPPRRSTDYTEFKIRNFSTESSSGDNYMYQFNRNKKKPASFVFNTYKNANRLGRQIIDIPKSLEKIIKDWSAFNKSDYLLVNNLGKQVSPSKITLWLNQIFNKQISSSMLRHIFLSDKFKGVDLEELQKTAADMGQGDIKTTLRYVQKEDSEENKKEEL